MGVMRFEIHPARLLDDWPEIHRAYVSHFDGRVFPTRVEIDGTSMDCKRQLGDSGKLHVAVPVPGFGRPMVSTSSLPEREEPFLLLVELARGKLSQLRDQSAAWVTAGMNVPEGFDDLRKSAQGKFFQACLKQDTPDAASELALDSLADTFKAAELLARDYVSQRLAVRLHRSSRLPASLGCHLGNAAPNDSWASKFTSTFNAASVPIEWRLIEPDEGEYNWDACDELVDWCQENRLLITGGPLLDLSPEGLPEWLWQWEHDFYNLQSFVCDFVETAISRYAGRIRHWEAAARVNAGGALALNEENRLSLVARVLEIARQIDDDIQLMVRVDQPWGGYQARGQHRLSPLQFVDALIRSGVGLSAVNLEIGLGYTPRGSQSRDLLEFSRLIDLWSCLGVPLHVTLAHPSSSAKDEQAKSDFEVDSTQADRWTPEAQADWIDTYLPMLMAKQVVVGIFWTHFTDANPHHFPNAGLVDAEGNAKPSLDRVVQFRKKYWEAENS